MQLLYRTTPNQLIVEDARDGSDILSLDVDDKSAVFSGTVNTAEHYRVDGVQVVSNQQAAIADLAASGGASDGTCRSTVNDILAALRAHGLIAT